MALKLIVIFVLLYLVARAIGNMVQAVLRDPKAPPPVEPPPQDRSPSWRDPAPRPPRHADPGIEDAKWVDLD
jgi:hypothetical protein